MAEAAQPVVTAADIVDAIRVRDEACDKVGAWWRAGSLNGHMRDHTQSPAWPEYLVACAAFDKIVESHPETAVSP